MQTFLSEKLNYNLKTVEWAFTENRIAVRFQYEYQNKKSRNYHAYGNENWEFDANNLLQKQNNNDSI